LVFREGQSEGGLHTTSLPSLIQAIKIMWVKGLPLAYFQKLARSAGPCRIKAVMTAKIQAKKY
jgi:hypothetical protein